MRSTRDSPPRLRFGFVKSWLRRGGRTPVQFEGETSSLGREPDALLAETGSRPRLVGFRPV